MFNFHPFFNQTLSLFILICCILENPIMANAQTIYYVDANATGAQNGQSWATAYQTLQPAIAAAVNVGDEIWVAAGTYYPTQEVSGTGMRFQTFQMKNGLKILGGFAGNENPNTFNLDDRNLLKNKTILSGDIGFVNDVSDNCYHLFYHPDNGLDATAILDGFTITGGNANGNGLHQSGGGMLNENVSPTIRNCVFSKNNASFDGGGMHNRAGAAPLISDCSFLENTAQYGGAIENTACSPTIMNTTFAGNTASVFGGAMEDFNNSNSIVVNCVFSGNHALDSGGALNILSTSHSILTNCTFSANRADTDGGAIYINASNSFTLNNSIIWHNQDQSGVGTANAGVFNNVGTFNNCNNLVQNVADNFNFSDSENNLGVTFANESNYPKFFKPIDPIEAPTTRGNFRILPCSRAINLGDAGALIDGKNGTLDVSANVPTDLDKNPRIYTEASGSDFLIDLGAYELPHTQLLATAGRMYVNANNFNIEQNGYGWETALTDLQRAIHYCACLDDPEIWVAEGTYLPSEAADGSKTNLRAATFFIDQNIRLFGGFPNTLDADMSNRNPNALKSILSGDFCQNDQLISNTADPNFPALNNDENAYTVLHTKGVTAAFILDGFQIMGGNANISDPNFTYFAGGGWYHENNPNQFDAAPNIINCDFFYNQANAGGAALIIGNGGYSAPTISNCIFEYNAALVNAGALMNSGNTAPLIVNTIFSDNRALDQGGAMFNVSNNNTCEPDIRNSLFLRNQAAFHGGAINNESQAGGTTNLSLNNCSFSGNTATGDGGAIRINGAGTTTLENTIIWNNRDNSGTGTASASINNSGGTLSFSHSLVQALTTADGNNNLDGTSTSGNANYPLFTAQVDLNTTPVSGGDLRLLNGSPAIDRGDIFAFPNAIDLLGFPRSMDGDGNGSVVIDLGCYETLGCPAAFSPILYVNDNIINGDGVEWNSALSDLQIALQIAAACPNVQEIWVAAGTYYPAQELLREATFSMQNNLAIRGGFAGIEPAFFQLSQRNFAQNPTILSGDIGTVGIDDDNSYHVFENVNLDNTAILDGFIIESGNANGTGSQSTGGGMRNNNCDLTITNCIFRNNYGRDGGAMRNSDSNPQINHTQFISNSSVFGGAMYNANSDPNFSHCVFQKNKVSASGGAILNEGLCDPTFENVVFAQNVAFSDGGSIYQFFNTNTLTLNNCTFSGNIANTGSSIHWNTAASANSSINNSIFWNNREKNGLSTIVENGSPVTYRHSLVEGRNLAGNNNLDGTNPANAPQFLTAIKTSIEPFAVENLRLAPTSPLIDQGSNTYSSLLTDLQGLPRQMDGSGNGNYEVDLGAFEALGCINASTARLYVAQDVNAGNGTAWNTPLLNLQNAIDIASICPTIQEIWVKEGIYFPTQSTTGSTENPRDFTFFFDSDIQLYGGFPNIANPTLADRDFTFTPTTLSGDFLKNDRLNLFLTDERFDGLSFTQNEENAYTVVHTEAVSSSFVMDGFTITGGKSDGVAVPRLSNGAAWYNDGSVGASNPTIRNCLFRDNAAINQGGAFYNHGAFGTANPTFEHCSFQTNLALEGGAIFNEGFGGTASPELLNCQFSFNLAAYGAAIYSGGDGGTTALKSTNNLFTNNKADALGSAFAYDDGDAGQPQFINCTFSRLTGAAIGTTFWNSGQQAPILTNCISWDNDATFTRDNNAGNLVINYSLLQESTCPTGATCDGNTLFNQDPLFDLNFNLGTNSPAIDRGDNSVASSPDLAGNQRIINNIIDLGAFEANSFPLPLTLLDFKLEVLHNQTIDLKWTTTDEVNISHFVLERATKEDTFEAITTVVARGDLQQKSAYSFVDKNPLSGWNYYRLRIVEVDQKSAHSQVLAAQIQPTLDVQIAPNPTTDFVQLQLTTTSMTPYQIQLLDVDGKILTTKEVETSDLTQVFDLRPYPAGTYFIKIKDGAQVYLEQIVKQ